VKKDEYLRCVSDELDIQLSVCDYLKIKYPGILFISNMLCLPMSPGMRQQAIKLNSQHAHADLFIVKPKQNYYGAYAEIKRSRAEIYNQRGEIRSAQHITDQREVLVRYQTMGYHAAFTCGYNETIQFIDDYLQLNDAA
jgi:hypothetical protein